MMVLGSRRGTRTPGAVLFPVKEISTALPSELSENLLRELESNQRPPTYGPANYQLFYPAMFSTTKIDNLFYSANSHFFLCKIFLLKKYQYFSEMVEPCSVRRILIASRKASCSRLGFFIQMAHRILLFDHPSSFLLATYSLSVSFLSQSLFATISCRSARYICSEVGK